MMVVVRCGKRAGAQGVRRRPFPGSRSGLAFRTLWRQSRMTARVCSRNAKLTSFAASRDDAEALAGGVAIAATLQASRHPPMPRRPPMAALQDHETETKPADTPA